MGDKKKKMTFFAMLVPGFLFQSVVIGGGYGTGNEIAQYFGVHGMIGGIIGMVTTLIVWSIIAAVTFEFCRVFRTFDYNSMSQKMLGKVGIIYEICYVVLMLIVLGVINATASSMFHDLAGISGWWGVAILSLGIIFLVLKGTKAIEVVLSFWSYVLYAVYITFMVITFVKFGKEIGGEFSKGLIPAQVYTGDPNSIGKCIVDGFKYSFYNLGIVPAILYTVRNCETRKEAVGCGLLAGAIAVIPAALLVLALGCDLNTAVANAFSDSTAVSAVFGKLDMRWLYVAFEIVLFGTLIETGSGFIKAVDDRIEVSASKGGKEVAGWVRPLVAIGLTVVGVCVSTFGLTDLIAKGYGTVCWGFLIVYVVPMLTLGVVKIAKGPKGTTTEILEAAEK